MSAITLDSLRFPINYIQVSQEICAALGIDPVRFLADEVGISPEMQEEPQAQITGSQFSQLLKQISAYVAERPDRQRKLIEFFPPTIHGYVALAAMTSATVRDALDIAVKYAHQVMPAFRMSYSVENGLCLISLKRLADFGQENALLSEMVFYAMYAFIQLFSQEKTAIHVSLTHENLVLSELPQIERNLAIETGAQHNVVRFSAKHLASTLTTRNSATCNAIELALRKNEERLMQQQDLAYRVSAVILNLIQDQKPIEARTVAAALLMSPRTLSRRLNEEGTSLRTLYNECRSTIARDLLSQKSMTINQISLQMGFSDEANFSRFFKSQTGESPTSFRASIASHGRPMR